MGGDWKILWSKMGMLHTGNGVGEYDLFAKHDYLVMPQKVLRSLKIALPNLASNIKQI